MLRCVEDAGRQVFRERPGLGDAIVLVAVLALFAMIFLPLRRGQQVGVDESEARSTLEALSSAAQSSGLLSALRSIQAASKDVADVEIFTRYYLGRVALSFLPTWEDNSYFYRLRLDEAASADGVLIDAEPRKPGRSGRESYHARGAQPADLEAQPIAVDRHLVDLRVEDNERRARERCSALAGIAVRQGLPEALRKFREQWRDLGQEEASPQGYPIMWTATHALRAWPIFEFAGGGRELGLEILAWPKVAGQSGFASFRVAGTSAVLQSRNLVRAYDAKMGREPRPGAGMARKASDKGRRSYLGVDGNHWFHAETHAAR